jgi:hypothetical protein
VVCFLESDSDIKQPFVCRNRLLGLESTSNTFIVSPKSFDDSEDLPSPPSITATPAVTSIVNSFLAIPRPIGLPIVLQDGDDPRTDRQRCGGTAPVPIGVPIGMPISDGRPTDPRGLVVSPQSRSSMRKEAVLPIVRPIPGWGSSVDFHRSAGVACDCFSPDDLCRSNRRPVMPRGPKPQSSSTVLNGNWNETSTLRT